MGAINQHRIHGSSRHISAIFIAGLTLGIWPASAQARDILLLAGGGFAFRSYSQYLGAVIPFRDQKGALSRNGMIMRFWQKSFAFSYTTDLSPNGAKNTRIDALGGGFTGELGYLKKLSKGEVAGFMGLTYRHFELSPDDPGADLNKKPLGIPLTLKADWLLQDKVSISSNLTYTAFHKDYWAQFKLKFQTSSSFSFGPEIVVQGGSEYRYLRLGGFVSGIKLGPFSIGANFGLRDDLRENKQSLFGDLHVSYFF